MKRQSIALVLILLSAALLRFAGLGSVPDGLQQDETSLGYNAYSILKTGKDEHGVSMPQNFKAFGEYKLPGYIYLSVAPIALLGPTATAIRLVSAVSGTLSVLLIYLIAGLLVRAGKSPKKLPLVAAALLAVNPWNIHFSRGAFETTLAATAVAGGTYLFLRGLERKRILPIIGSVLPFALAVYSYNIGRLFVPVFLGYLIVSFLPRLTSIHKRLPVLIPGAFGLLCLPFLASFFSAQGIGSTKGTIIFTSAAVQSQLLELRTYFAGSAVPWLSQLFNRPILTVWFYAGNLVNYLNVDFLFIHGPAHGNHGIGTTGLWYLFELPTIVYGVYLLITRRDWSGRILLPWIILTIGIAALTRESPQATRSFFIDLPVTVLSAYGLIHVVTGIAALKRKPVRWASYAAGAAVIISSVVFYLGSYFIRFPIYYAKSWRTADRELSMYLARHEKEYNTIIFDDASGFVYTSLLYYLPYRPADFQGAAWSPDDGEGFSHPVRFGKYEFKTVDWNTDPKRPNTLIVTAAGKHPSDAPVIADFKYPERPVVLSVKEQIMSFPVEDPAYDLVQFR